MYRWVIVVLLVSAALGVLFWKFGPALFSGKVAKNPELIVWVFAEDEQYIKPVLQDFLKVRPNTKVTLVTQTHVNYFPRLMAQLRSGKGPDIFPIHSSSVANLSDELSFAPDSIISSDEFSKTYYPVMVQSFVFDKKVYGLPVELDGLNLFENEDITKGANVAAQPSSWGEFIEGAKKMTVKDSAGVIQTAGASMGTTSNVDFWPEITELLYLEQPHGSLVSPNNSDGEEVLKFYSSFVIDPKNKTWDLTLPNSSSQFTQGKLGYYFGNLQSAALIKAQNPSLNFKGVLIPQLPGKKVGVGSFWAYGVSKRSEFSDAAWELNKYLTSPGSLQKINDGRALANILPKAYPRVSMANLQQNDPILGSMIAQAPYLQAWYLNSNIEDSGVNDEVVGAYKGALDQVLKGIDYPVALNQLNGDLRGILGKYTFLITLK